jgi:phage repressor protein C with HTH and peptisase S24 domain
MVNKLTTGSARESAHIYALAKALDCSPEYLAGDDDAIDVGKASETRHQFSGFPVKTFEAMAETVGLVPVRQLDLAYGMGATFLDVPVTENVRHFPREWLRQYTKAPPEKIAFAQGVGDSMAPTLLDSDTLIIDLSNPTLTMSDQIWVVAYHQLGMVKRLRPSKDGGLRLMSDNPTVPEEVAYDGEVQLIGRVAGFVRKM